jgi:DNA-directed RNA polymerase
MQLKIYIYIKKQYNIKIPILFDASCSGVQQLSAITFEFKVAKMVNVVSSLGIKNDFYQIAGDYVVDKINNMDLDTEIKEKLKLIKVTRSILKLPVMTITYNVGLAKMSKELQKTKKWEN